MGYQGCQKIDQDELKQVSDQVIADIKKSSPDYFKELKAAVYSGDYEKVNSVIDQGSQIMAKVLKEEFDKRAWTKENQRPSANAQRLYGYF